MKILTSDIIDILQHFIPTENEVKAFTSYLADGKSLLNLSDEDRFLHGVSEQIFSRSPNLLPSICFQLSKVERLSQKLHVVSFMANFDEIHQHLVPQLKAVITASTSLKSNQRFRKILEVNSLHLSSYRIFSSDYSCFWKLYEQ